MDKNIEERLVASLDEVQKWVGTGTDFVAEQAPLVAQEVIRWGIGADIFGMSMGFMTIVLGLMAARWAYLRGWSDIETCNNANAATFITFLVSIGAILVGLPIMLIHTYDLVFILCAPRLYILQELSQLINSVSR